MTNKIAINSRAFSPKFDIEKRLTTSVIEKSNIKIAVDVSNDQFPTRAWHPDCRLQLSSEKWINKYGLKANNLDSLTLFPKLGFPRIESFNTVLHKPIHSRYGEHLFPKHFREDGLTFNIVAKKDRLKQAQIQLENAISLYQQRLDWLSSESRRIFGVLEEHCITVIIDVKTTSKIEFDQFICAVERLINEQLRHCVKFNLIRVQDSMSQLFASVTPVSKDTLGLAIDWLWLINLTESTNSANIVEAMIRASKDNENEAIYLITEGNSSDGSREVLREKVKQLRVPFNIVSYNCNDSGFLEYLYCLTTLTGGRFHTYTFNMEIDAYEPSPLDDVNPIANLTLKKKVYGGNIGGIGKRNDCVNIFSEIEEAKVILSQIKSLINQIPDKNVPYDEQSQGIGREGHIPKEEYMSSREWLSTFGLKPRKLDFFDVLGGVCFRHCDGVVEVLEPPPPDKIDIMEQQDATIHQKLVNAKYCDKFAHVRWKDGSLVHVQMSSDVHRLYNERMNICLNAIKRRIEWLRQGSRELFGTIMEDQVYILIDTSSSMEPHIVFVKDKIYTLIQEQLRHKSKINFVAFNSKALPWRDRLIDVTESSLTSAWHWIEGLSCQGSTNTLAALQFAIKDRNCQGIYLLTDGRPDQPAKMVLSQIKLQHRLPIHTISFNCADLDANKFLCELARETGGRFHYFNEITGGADCADDEELEAWESEDIQVLKAEYRLGTESLDKVTKLRDECHRLAWKREIELQNEQKTPRKIMPPGCNDGLFRSKKIPSRISSSIPDRKSPKRIKSRNTYKKEKNDPGAYFSFLQALNTHSKDEDDWMLQETKDVLDRQKERYINTVQEEMKESTDKMKATSNKKKHQCKELTIKQWLNIYGLVPQHMSILDALAPTIVKVRPKYVPIIDKHVMSKVFDEILPIAHVVTEGSPRRGYKPVVRLVNPLAVDLKAYQNNLDKLLNKYKRKLKQLIKDTIGDEALEEFEIMTTKSPIGSVEMKEWILNIFKDANWPVCEDDIQMFLKEIYVGHKYFIQAGDLIRVQRKALDTGNVAEEGPLEVESRSVSKHPPFSQVMQAAMNGVPVLAPGVLDGYYYEADIINWPDCENVEVQYNAFGNAVQIPVEQCIIMPLKDVIVKPGMKALIKVFNIDNDRTFYLPGIIISPPTFDSKAKVERFLVSLYNGIESDVRKDEIVIISKERYDAIVQNIQNIMEEESYTTSSSMSSSLMSTFEDDGERNDESKKEKTTKSNEVIKTNKSQPPASKNKYQKQPAKKNQLMTKHKFKGKNKKSSSVASIHPVYPLVFQDTTENNVVQQHQLEIISEPQFINVAVVNDNVNKGLNQSQTIKNVKKRNKNVPEKQRELSNLESSITNIKELPKKEVLNATLQSRKSKNITKDKQKYYSSEQTLSDFQEVGKLKTNSKTSKTSLMQIDLIEEKRQQESIKSLGIEGYCYSILNENYRIQPLIESDKTNSIGVSKGPRIKSKIKTSPLSSDQTTIPVFIAEQFPGINEHVDYQDVEISKKGSLCCINEIKPEVQFDKPLPTLEIIPKEILSLSVETSPNVLTSKEEPFSESMKKKSLLQTSQIIMAISNTKSSKSLSSKSKEKIIKSSTNSSTPEKALLNNERKSATKRVSKKETEKLEIDSKIVSSKTSQPVIRTSKIDMDIQRLSDKKTIKKDSFLKATSNKKGKKLHTTDRNYVEFSIDGKEKDESEHVNSTDFGNDKTSQTKNKSFSKKISKDQKDIEKELKNKKIITDEKLNIKIDQRNSKDSLDRDDIKKIKKAETSKNKRGVTKEKSIEQSLCCDTKVKDSKHKMLLKEDLTVDSNFRPVSPFTARSNVTVMEDEFSKVYNIVLTPEPPLVLIQAKPECKSFQISSITLSIKEIPSINFQEALLTPIELIHEHEKNVEQRESDIDKNSKKIAKSSDELCGKCHLPKEKFGPADDFKPNRNKSS